MKNLCEIIITGTVWCLLCERAPRQQEEAEMFSRYDFTDTACKCGVNAVDKNLLSVNTVMSR